MKISANILVENEENFVWFAVESIIGYVDEVIVFDAGSIDSTPQILDALQKKYPQKIQLTTIKKLTPQEYPAARQTMLEASSGDWILIVDGDEVWPEASIKYLVSCIKNDGTKLDSIATHFKVPVGDLFHFQEDSAGRYDIDGVVGHLTIRAINCNIPNLRVLNDYGKEGYFSGDTSVQSLDSNKRLILPKKYNYLHLTHLPRTGIHSQKVKYDLGIETPLDYYYPEAFFFKHPAYVPTPFYLRSSNYKIRSWLRYPLVSLKRKIILNR